MRSAELDDLVGKGAAWWQAAALAHDLERVQEYWPMDLMPHEEARRKVQVHKSASTEADSEE